MRDLEVALYYSMYAVHGHPKKADKAHLDSLYNPKLLEELLNYQPPKKRLLPALINQWNTLNFKP